MQNHASHRKLVRALIICLLCPDLSYAVTSSPDRPEMRAYLQAEQNRLSTSFARESLLDALNYDADEIVGFVRNDVAFQPYPGVLRGVEGTLAARAGNAHDQALTLAALLKDAGYDAQILVGELSASQAASLTNSMAMPVLPDMSPSPSMPAAVRELQDKLAAMSVDARDLARETEGTVNRISTSLDEAGTAVSSMTLSRDALESTRHYRWVRYREGPSDPWTEVHPAAPEGADWSVSTTSVEAEQIDSADLQKVAMELWIENSAGERHVVSGRWQAPVANLIDHRLSIEIVSDGMLNRDLWQQPEQLVRNSQFFYVMVDDTVLEDARVFDLYGDTYGKSALEGLGTLFSTVNRAGSKAVGALSGISARSESADAGRHLTRVGIDFSVEVPGEPPRVTTRHLYEGRAMEAQEDAARTLLQRWDVDFSGGSMARQWYQERNAHHLADLLDQMNQLRTFYEKNPQAPDSQIYDQAADTVAEDAARRLNYLRSVFALFRVSQDIVSYAPAVNILAIRQGISGSKQGWRKYEMVDIITNTHWSFRRIASTIVPDIPSTVARGVWETRAEAFQPVANEDVVLRDSAYDRLAAAQTYRYRQESEPQAISLVASGQSGVPSGTAWWQVDARNGSTIGMFRNDSGIDGGSATEQISVNFITMSISGMFCAVATIQCVQGGGSALCCILGNVYLMIGSGGVAFAAGGLASLVVGGGMWGQVLMGVASIGTDVAYAWSGASPQCN